MASPPSTALLDHHRDNNRATSASWQDFSAHRERLTGLIEAALAETPAASLAILGAGNCNDVDLARLAPLCRAIALVDLDTEAVARARARQPPDVARKLVVHAPLDLSGLYDRLPRFRGKAASAGELGALPQVGCTRVLDALLGAGGFDVVVSACCLSQLMHSCYLALGRHPQLEAIADAVARAHLRSLLGLLRPGGAVVLASDMVSSETYPIEELWGVRTPLAMLAELERAGNFLSGTAPSIVRRQFSSDPAIAALADGAPRLIEPWPWHLGGDMSLLVYALVARRRS